MVRHYGKESEDVESLDDPSPLIIVPGGGGGARRRLPKAIEGQWKLVVAQVLREEHKQHNRPVVDRDPKEGGNKPNKKQRFIHYYHLII